MDAFSQLVAERQRALFVFYGHRAISGEPGGPYFKQAHSLSEALADLEGNSGVADEGGYFVRDAFLEHDDGGLVLRVELISLRQILSGESESTS